MAASNSSTPVQHDDAAWQPRTIDVSGTVNRYSKFVSWMRIALPISAGLAIFFYYFFKGLLTD